MWVLQIFSFFKIVLATPIHLHFHISFQIRLWVSKKFLLGLHWLDRSILEGRHLNNTSNPWTQCVYLDLFFFHQCFVLFSIKILLSDLQVFHLFRCCYKWYCFLNFISNILLLVHRNAIDFCILTLYFVTLINSLFINSKLEIFCTSHGIFYIDNHVISE